MLEVENLSKHYDEIRAVEELNFRVEQGEFATLLGPSGCGKSTTLHSIAGLVDPTSGTIRLRGSDITSLSPSARDLGLVFQKAALFPHMTAAENIAYGLEMHGWDEEATADRVQEMLELVHLPDHGDHRPDELSGGQQQRIAFARAIAYEPDILLLDEPLTGLDRVLREEMRREIKRIQEEVDLTTLYVTHDQEEALSLSDKIIVLNDGKKQQEGSSREIYQEPANQFVAEFVGKSTKFSGTVTASSSSPEIESQIGPVTLPAGTEPGREIAAYVRPSDVDVSYEPEGGANEFEGAVAEVTNLGTRAEMVVRVRETDVLLETERFPVFSTGDTVYVRFDPEDVVLV